MNCPHCQRLLPDPTVASCPFCGQPISAPGQDATAAPVAAAQPAVDPGETRPTWEQPAPIAPPTTTPPPTSTPPASPVQPSPAPSAPIPQQAQAPSQPQQPPAQPAFPSYGPPRQALPQPTQQPQGSRVGCVVGVILALLLVAIVGGGIAYLSNQANGITIGGLTLGGTKTGPFGGTLLYQDALDGSTKDQWTNNTDCFSGDGGYHIKASFICYAPTDSYGDVVTTVSVKEISGPTTYLYGLVIRRVSTGNYYSFDVDANGKWLFEKAVNGKVTVIDDYTPNAAIKTGLNQINTLSVQAKGSHFVFTINGTQVGTADDSTFSSGRTGLEGNDGIETVFTNLSIEKIKS